ncbi:MAG: tetratricopeptide repeat protein [Planctomycetota bacterium]|jgi:hypothetical protein
MTTGRALLTWIGVLTLGRAAVADSVTLVGSSIPLRGCEIQAIQGGRVHFTDAGGRRQRRALEEIDGLGFDDLPALDDAEIARREADYPRALRGYLVACAGADRDVARLWTHVRLAQTHDVLGQFVQAAGHAAVVFQATDDPTWRMLVPRSEPDEPTYAAAHESITWIDQAARRVTDRQLLRLLAELRLRVATVHAKLASSHDGPIPAPGSTISGIPVERILAGEFDGSVARGPSEPPAPPATTPAPPTVTPVTPPATEPAETTGTSPDAIDRLLAEQRWAEALAACARVEASPGRRDLAEFLHQYGRALDGGGRPRDAAVMWTRCAVHFEASPAGLESLLEVARLYRDEFDRPGTARRLLERVILRATAVDEADLAGRATTMLNEIGAPATSGMTPEREP